MVRESGIPATKPAFTSYLLPSMSWLKFTRSFSAALPSIWRGNASSSSERPPNTAPSPPASPHPDAPAASEAEDEDEEEDENEDSTLVAPEQNHGRDKGYASWNHLTRLGCTAGDTLKCMSCSADLAFASQIISKGFTGRYGRAILVAPTRHPKASSADGESLLNIRIGNSESRELATGWHTVADVSCENCLRTIGWKYIEAQEPEQQYKVGKFILETERVVTFKNWDWLLGDKNDDAIDEWAIDAWGYSGGRREEEVQFDSEDEEECEELFSGTWNPRTVAKRRKIKEMAMFMQFE